MKKTTVIYGGTFDPVHHGHLITARAVAEARGFDKVILMPSASPPHKGRAHADGAERLEMLRLATAGDDLFEVSDVEIRRPGKSYTFDTLQELREARGAETELAWIVGADMLADLPDWHRANEVLDMAQIIVAMRPPWHERIDAVLADLAGRLGRTRVDKLVAARVKTPLIDISSTEIRHRVAAGLPIRYMVCNAVDGFIRENGLYLCET